VVDEDASHQLGGRTEELCPVLPANARLVHEPDVRFVDERRRLERVIRTLAAQPGPGQAVKLRVHDRHQLVERAAISGAPGLKKARDVRWRRLVIHDTSIEARPGEEQQIRNYGLDIAGIRAHSVLEQVHRGHEPIRAPFPR